MAAPETISGLDRHPMLYKYITKAEQRLVPGDEEEAAIALRKACEEMVEEFIKQKPSCYDPSLFKRITNLEERDLLSREESALFHSLRKIGNEGGAHAGDVASLSELKAVYNRTLDYLPEFLSQFPSPGEAVPHPKDGQKLSPLLDLKINYDRIKPLLINVPNPYVTFEIAALEKEREGYIENGNVYEDYEVCKWIKDIDKYTYRSNGKLYLDRKKMMREYEKLIKEKWANQNYWLPAEDSVWGDNTREIIYLPFILWEYVGYNIGIWWNPEKRYAEWYNMSGPPEYWMGYLYNPEFENYSTDFDTFAQQIKEIYEPIKEWETVTYNGPLRPNGVYSKPVYPDWVKKFARNFGYDTVRDHSRYLDFLNYAERRMGLKPTKWVLLQVFPHPQPQPAPQPKPQPRPQPATQARPQPKPQAPAQSKPAQTQQGSKSSSSKPGKRNIILLLIGIWLLMVGGQSIIVLLLSIFSGSGIPGGLLNLILSLLAAYFGLKLIVRNLKKSGKK